MYWHKIMCTKFYIYYNNCRKSSDLNTSPIRCQTYDRQTDRQTDNRQMDRLRGNQKSSGDLSAMKLIILHLPHVPWDLILILRCCVQLATLRWHSLVYVTPSLPHTGVNKFLQRSTQLHSASAVTRFTEHWAPNAQNLRSQGAEMERVKSLQ